MSTATASSAIIGVERHPTCWCGPMRLCAFRGMPRQEIDSPPVVGTGLAGSGPVDVSHVDAALGMGVAL